MEIEREAADFAGAFVARFPALRADEVTLRVWFENYLRERPGPRPSETMTIQVVADLGQFEAAMERALARIREVQAAANELPGLAR